MKGTLDCIPLGGQQSLRRASYSVPHGFVFHLPGTDFEVQSARAPVKHFPLFQSSALTSPITYSVVCKQYCYILGPHVVEEENTGKLGTGKANLPTMQ